MSSKLDGNESAGVPSTPPSAPTPTIAGGSDDGQLFENSSLDLPPLVIFLLPLAISIIAMVAVLACYFALRRRRRHDISATAATWKISSSSASIGIKSLAPLSLPPPSSPPPAPPLPPPPLLTPTSTTTTRATTRAPAPAPTGAANTLVMDLARELDKRRQRIFGGEDNSGEEKEEDASDSESWM